MLKAEEEPDTAQTVPEPGPATDHFHWQSQHGTRLRLREAELALPRSCRGAEQQPQAQLELLREAAGRLPKAASLWCACRSTRLPGAARGPAPAGASRSASDSSVSTVWVLFCLTPGTASLWQVQKFQSFPVLSIYQPGFLHTGAHSSLSLTFFDHMALRSSEARTLSTELLKNRKSNCVFSTLSYSQVCQK